MPEHTEIERITLDVASVTEDELDRARSARTFAHETTCPRGGIDPAPCRACPSAAGIVLALRALDERPSDVRTARRALHDQVCASGCGPDSDHADRTQTKPATALRKFHAEVTR